MVCTVILGFLWLLLPFIARCLSDEIYRHGHSSARHERFRCRSCRRVFQLSYTCEARTLGVKYHIVDMAFNGADVRD
ncbi:IS1 family transposase, partial [Salmonella enterica]|nr:IS1 family transposase [Salmonella enterica]